MGPVVSRRLSRCSEGFHDVIASCRTGGQLRQGPSRAPAVLARPRMDSRVTSCRPHLPAIVHGIIWMNRSPRGKGQRRTLQKSYGCHRRLPGDRAGSNSLPVCSCRHAAAHKRRAGRRCRRRRRRGRPIRLPGPALSRRPDVQGPAGGAQHCHNMYSAALGWCTSALPASILPSCAQGNSAPTPLALHISSLTCTMAKIGAWMRRATRQVLCCHFRGRVHRRMGACQTEQRPVLQLGSILGADQHCPALLLLLLVQFQRDMIAAEQPDLVIFR